MKTNKKRKNAPARNQTGAADTFCDARLAAGHVTLALADLIKATGLSAIAARWQLSRLRGKVARISPRQPFYLIVSPEHRAAGAPPPNWWLHDYFDWLGRPYYLALQSAASAHGSNPQAPQITQVITDRPVRPITIGKIQVRFFVKRAIAQTPAHQPPGAVAPLRVSTPEATAYDLIRYATAVGGIERAAETIRPLLPLMRARELKRVLVAQAKNEHPVARRLGFILDTFQTPLAKTLAKTIRDWLPAGKLPPIMLVPLKTTNRPRTGKNGAPRGALAPLNARWQVFNNPRELKP